MITTTRTFAERRLRVIARRASRICETKTVGHHSCDKLEGWLVVPWSRHAVESVIAAACREAVELDRKRRGTG